MLLQAYKETATLCVSYGPGLQTALLRLGIRGKLCSMRKQYRTETVLLSTFCARQFAVVERTLCRVIRKSVKKTQTTYPSRQIICATHAPYFLLVILCRNSREICADFITLKQTLPLLWTTVILHFGYLTTTLPPSGLHAKRKNFKTSTHTL